MTNTAMSSVFNMSVIKYANKAFPFIYLFFPRTPPIILP